MKNIVLLGKLGHGKTTVFNKITNAAELTPSGGGSATKNVYIKKSSSGNLGFQVIDTPGFGVLKDKIKHVAGVLTALLEGPLHQIFIVVKYQRTDVLKTDFLEIFKIFFRYRVMVSVIVSWWDQCELENQAIYKKEIQDSLSSLQINQILFASKNDTAESLCLGIENVIYSLASQKVEFTDTEILSEFKIELEVNDGQEINLFKIDNDTSNLQTNYRKICLQIQQKIISADFPPNILPDFLRALIIFAKKQSVILIDQFEKKNQSLIDEMTEKDQNKAFLLHFRFKKALQIEYNKLVDLQNQKLLDKNVICFKHIKRCNYCGLIWIKASGCEGKTVCGRIFEKGRKDDLLEQDKLELFQIKYENDQIIVQHKGQALDNNKLNAIAIEKNLQVKEDVLRRRQNQVLGSETFQVGDIGCKNIIQWDQLQSISKKEFEEVFGQDKLLDYFAEQDQEIEKRLISLQNAYQKQMDNSLKEQKNNIKRL